MNIDRDYSEFIATQIAAHPVEAEIVTRLFTALQEAGNPLAHVYDGADLEPVESLQDVLDLVFNLDEAYLYTRDGDWVFIVLDNEWDTICDYTLSLENALTPVNTWIDSHNN